MTRLDDPDALERHVVETFPYPVAVNLMYARRARQKGESTQELLHLLVTAEIFAQLLASTMLLDCVSFGTVEERRGRLAEALSQPGKLDVPTLGSWCRFFCTASRLVREAGVGFFDAEAESLRRLERPLRALPDLRNRKSHPEWRPSDVDAQQHLAPVRRQLRKALRAADFLSRYRLIALGPRGPWVRNEILVTLLQGAVLPVEGRWLEIEADAREGDLVLIRPELDEFLCLRPFFVASRGNEDADGLWAFHSSNAGRARYGVVDRFTRDKSALHAHGILGSPAEFLEAVAASPSPRVRGRLVTTDTSKAELASSVDPPSRLAATLGVEDVRPLSSGMTVAFRARRARRKPQGIVVAGSLDTVEARAEVVIKASGPVGAEVERFEREFELLHEITHHGVTKVHALVRDEERSYLVLPWVDGVALSQILHERVDDGDSPLPEELAVEIAKQLVDAVRAIHQVGAHGDLKPGNLICDDPVSPTKLTVIDLGAGTTDRAASTELATSFGTRGYVAPEWFSSWDEDPPDARRADLYSLAVVLYQIFSGRMPHLDDDGKSIDVGGLDAPRPWRIAIRWCGHVDARRRPRSAAEMVEFLEGKRDAPAALASGVGYRSPLRDAVSNGVMAGSAFLVLSVVFAALGSERYEYLILGAGSLLASAVTSARMKDGDDTSGEAAEQGEARGHDWLGSLLTLGLMLSLVFGAAVFIANEPFEGMGFEGWSLSAARLLVCAAAVGAYLLYKQIERRWD